MQETINQTVFKLESLLKGDYSNAISKLWASYYYVKAAKKSYISMIK